MSFVDVSPSTETALNVASTSSRSTVRKNFGATAASVHKKASVVAMFGAIMPAPFATPTTRALVFGPSGTRCSARFSKRSVVMIARTKSSSPSARAPRTSRGVACTMRSIGSGCPITPVDATSTRFLSQPMARAAYSAIAAASNTPLSPVQALALPLLTMMARATPALTLLSDSSTGAARTRFWVNTAAVGTSSSATTSPRSGRPRRLMPATMPANLNPGQAGAAGMPFRYHIRGSACTALALHSDSPARVASRKSCIDGDRAARAR